jgi:hypothetical protein
MNEALTDPSDWCNENTMKINKKKKLSIKSSPSATYNQELSRKSTTNLLYKHKK